jgi:hypothetical protein
MATSEVVPTSGPELRAYLAKRDIAYAAEKASDAPKPRTSTPGGCNLRIKGPGKGFHLGVNPHGKVVPPWVAELCGRSAERLVADGTCEWTDDIAVPGPKDDWRAPMPTAPDDGGRKVDDAVWEELERLRRSEIKLIADNNTFKGIIDEQGRKLETLEPELGKLTIEKAHWQGMSENYRVQVEELTAGYEEQEKVKASLDVQVKDLLDKLDKANNLNAAKDTVAKSKPAPGG